MEHSITLKDRSSLHISGIEHIYSFNDKKVELRTSAGEMVIEGENLDMGKLSFQGTRYLSFERERLSD